jgi:hypothetical protein
LYSYEVTRREVQEVPRICQALAHLLRESGNAEIVQTDDCGYGITNFMPGVGEALKPDIQLAEAKSQ